MKIGSLSQGGDILSVAPRLVQTQRRRLGDEAPTYSGLEIRANRIARHLGGRGVGRGSIVAMLLPRSVEAYAALLGILKSGAAYVPIDPEYPADRVAYILEDSGAGALVTT